ncbi:MAG TPA: bifunctional DNA-formamidopyrimidine glycosylase/DNA-(apurinic or apyrimidinic site) lyase [Terriglobales bacterium]|nr:bifunctional DNA-formamidopyrimidine glycosylase/DNA-(apurinic or apyrimidinic site) lyase [Terriglobales bacterium]
MPELPEVETVVRGLRKTVLGKKIKSLKIYPSRILHSPAESLRRNLLQQRIREINRRGKNIILKLSNGDLLLIHLGMTGNLVYMNGSIPMGKHDHIDLEFSDRTHLRYSDIRKFGRFKLIKSSQVTKEGVLKKLGPEPLEISRDDFVKLLQGKKGRIKSVLMNQSIIAGIGNIYADEVLFEAKIHPLQMVSDLSRNKLMKLHSAIQKILKKAIKAGGSSVDDYRDVDGKKGFFQFYHKVYGRAGEPCKRCGTKIRRIIVSQRSTHFCPRCQREP